MGAGSVLNKSVLGFPNSVVIREKTNDPVLDNLPRASCEKDGVWFIGPLYFRSYIGPFL